MWPFLGMNEDRNVPMIHKGLKTADMIEMRMCQEDGRRGTSAKTAGRRAVNGWRIAWQSRIYQNPVTVIGVPDERDVDDPRPQIGKVGGHLCHTPNDDTCQGVGGKGDTRRGNGCGKCRRSKAKHAIPAHRGSKGRAALGHRRNAKGYTLGSVQNAMLVQVQRDRSCSVITGGKAVGGQPESGGPKRPRRRG